MIERIPISNRKVTTLPAPRKPLGLGDAIERVAQPIARTIDRVLGTNVQNCGGCKKRKEAANALLPDLRKPFD